MGNARVRVEALYLPLVMAALSGVFRRVMAHFAIY